MQGRGIEKEPQGMSDKGGFESRASRVEVGGITMASFYDSMDGYLYEPVPHLHCSGCFSWSGSEFDFHSYQQNGRGSFDLCRTQSITEGGKPVPNRTVIWLIEGQAGIMDMDNWHQEFCGFFLTFTDDTRTLARND